MMKRNIWVGVYAASFTLFLLTLMIIGFVALLAADRIFEMPVQMYVPLIVVVVLAYLQFLIVQTVYGFMLLAKMWGSIQDGVTPVSVGKAIGFLFIPVFSVYWVFVAWGSFPRQYNDYIERYKLKAPYLSGGVYTALPIMILLSGLLVFPLFALPVVFALVIAQTADAVNNLATAKEDRQKGIAQPIPRAPVPRANLIPAALSGFIAVSVVFWIGLFIFIVHSPTTNANFTPATVGKFKLDYDYVNGGFFGLRKEYSASYKLADGSKKGDAIGLRLSDLWREVDVAERYDKLTTCYGTSEIKETTVKDKSGNVVGNFKSCGKKDMSFRIGKRFIVVSNSSAAAFSPDEMMQFFVSLPFNAEIDAAGLTAIAKTISGSSSSLSSSPSSPDTKTDVAGTPVTAADQADFTMTAEAFDKDTDGANGAKNKTKYAGKVIEIAGRFYLSFGADTIDLNAGKNKVSLKVAAESQPEISKMKEDERLTFKCRGDDSSYRTDLINCVMTASKGIMSPDETPDFTFTAQEYYKIVGGSQSVESQIKKQAFYAGKIIELSGKVKAIGNSKEQLQIKEYTWIDCKPDAENLGQFTNLVEGQEVKFKGLGSPYSSGLKHCIVVSQ